MSTSENFFRTRREELGITQRVIADRLRMTCAAVSSWERGGIPSLALVPRLAEIYGVSAARLLREMLTLATADCPASGHAMSA
jgi:transcriptional regulator with XRE-family HTH domain